MPVRRYHYKSANPLIIYHGTCPENWQKIRKMGFRTGSEFETSLYYARLYSHATCDQKDPRYDEDGPVLKVVIPPKLVTTYFPDGDIGMSSIRIPPRFITQIE